MPRGLAATLVSCIACASPTPTMIEGPTRSTTSPHDAAITSVSDASSTSIQPPTDRTFKPPAALPPPGPATSATARCLDPAYEHGREVAALDAGLRATRGMLLQGQLLHTSGHAVGTSFRGANGEQWLVVGQQMSCGAHVPLLAIDADLAVFEVYPVAKATESRKLPECSLVCGGCGIPTPLVSIVVNVPDHAHLVAPRSVSYPIDVKIDALPAVDANGRPMHCSPVPSSPAPH